jgi:hypothetical protein
MRNLFNGMNRKVSALLSAASVLGVTATAAAALFYVYPTSSYPLGKSYSTHAANWWKWALAQPADKSPLLDTTGANCAQGQSGLVWYLAGSWVGPVSRSCTIPAGKHLVFPIVNAAYFAFESDPAEQKTEAFVRSQVEDIINSTKLEVEIDGVAVKNPERLFERSNLFSVTLGANNVFDLPAGFKLSPSVDAGYYVVMAPLLGGQHTVHFYAEAFDGSVQDVTYNLNVRWW